MVRTAEKKLGGRRIESRLKVSWIQIRLPLSIGYLPLAERQNVRPEKGSGDCHKEYVRLFERSYRKIISLVRNLWNAII